MMSVAARECVTTVRAHDEIDSRTSMGQAFAESLSTFRQLPPPIKNS